MPPISLCLYMYVPRQQLGKNVTAATNTRNNRRIVGRVVFCAVCVITQESLWVSLCIPLSLLGNGSVNTFPRQREIVGGVVFYAVRVVSKGNRRLILPRTSCYYVFRSDTQEVAPTTRCNIVLSPSLSSNGLLSKGCLRTFVFSWIYSRDFILEITSFRYINGCLSYFLFLLVSLFNTSFVYFIVPCAVYFNIILFMFYNRRKL
jgi:hypothetical protein